MGQFYRDGGSSYLPVYLKPCFLYMGTYPKNMEIVVSELIEFWVAEGFLKTNKVQSSEEVAEGYLRDLIDRNLLLVSRHTSSGEVYSCNIHDLVRQLSLMVAEKERFFCVLNNQSSRAIHTERRIIVHEDSPREERNPEIFHALRSAQLIRSLKWKCGKLSFDLRLLRILGEVDEKGGAFDYFQHVNMRYIISDSRTCVLPSSISMLWNLQTLKSSAFDMNGDIPSEIWDMPHLRHLRLPLFCLPDPPVNCHRSHQHEEFVLRNLQTLTDVKNFRMSEEVCRRLPNIKKLSLYYCDLPNEGQASSFYFSHNLSRFHKLESLRLYFEEATKGVRNFGQGFTFSSSLRKLLLQGCGLDWEDLTAIGALPHLEVLYLNRGSVKGPEWSPIEGGFPSLKLLYIECDDLICWNAESSHFPVLEELQLKDLSKLEEIPIDIGEIPTLRVMKLEGCSISATISAMEILVEQESAGNEGLRLNVYSYTNQERESFKEEMEQLGLRSDSIVLEPYSWIPSLMFSFFYNF